MLHSPETAARNLNNRNGKDMALRRWKIALKCPRCGAQGRGVFSYDADREPEVEAEELPQGFMASFSPLSEAGVDVLCIACNRPAVMQRRWGFARAVAGRLRRAGNGRPALEHPAGRAESGADAEEAANTGLAADWLRDLRPGAEKFGMHSKKY